MSSHNRNKQKNFENIANDNSTPSGDQIQLEILNVLKDTREQNKKLIEQNDKIIEHNDAMIQQGQRSWRLGKTAERAFFGIAGPYYMSQFGIHALEDVVKTYPHTEKVIYLASILAGAILAYIEPIHRFKNNARDLLTRSRIKGSEIIKPSNDRFIEASTKLYFGFNSAANSATSFTKEFPKRSVRMAKKVFGKRLTH